MRKKLIATLLMVAAITTACGAASPAQASDPPGRPTGVSAEVQWGQVVIKWDSPADPGVTHHRVYRQTEEQDETLAGETDSPETTSFTDPGAERGKTHAYRVSAADPRGESEKSAPASVTLPPEPIETTAGVVQFGGAEPVNPRNRPIIRYYAEPITADDPAPKGTNIHVRAPPMTWNGTLNQLRSSSWHPVIRRILLQMNMFLRYITATEPAQVQGTPPAPTVH